MTGSAKTLDEPVECVVAGETGSALSEDGMFHTPTVPFAQPAARPVELSHTKAVHIVFGGCVAKAACRT